VQPGAGAIGITGLVPALPQSSPTAAPDPGAIAIFGLQPTIVISGDGLLSAKYMGRRKNVPFKPLGGAPPKKKRKEEPKPPEKPKVSPLMLGLLARGLTLPDVPAPAAPLLELDPPGSIEVPIAPIDVPVEPPAPRAPMTLEEVAQLVRDSQAALLDQLQQLRAEVAQLRAGPADGPAEIPLLRDPVNDALHAILPALRDPIDFDAEPPALPEEPEEPAPIAPPPAPRMTPEQIRSENERRIAIAAQHLL
jgi:hypothetical protein